MILVYIVILLMLLYNIKIFKIGEYNSDVLGMKNSTALKGLAAVVVVLHHVSQRIDNVGVLFLFRNLGYLSVSLFFFYSGYGMMKSYNSKKNYLNKFWTNRIPKVMIPFILANIIFMILYSLSGRTFSAYDILTYIVGIKLLDSFKWYVIAIFIFYCGFYFMFKFFKKEKAIIGMFFLLTLYCITCYLIGLGDWWYNATYCFFIGILFAEYYKLIFDFIKKRYIVITLGIATIFTASFIVTISKGSIFSVISSVCFVLLCVCLLMKFEIGNKYLNLLGTISYEIYLVHRILLDTFLTITDNKYIYLILCITTSIFIAYLFNLLINKIYSIIYMNVNNKHNKITA